MAYSVLQSAATGSTGSALTTSSVTFSAANLTSGTKLIVYVALSGGSTQTVSSVKDAAGNTFAQVSSLPNGSVQNTSVWQLDTPAGDVGIKPVITATVSSACVISLLVQEVSGLAAGTTNAVVLDSTPGTKTGSGGTSTGSPVYSSGVSGEYLVAVYGDDGGPATFTVPVGYTGDPSGVNGNSDADIGVAWKDSTGGTETGSWVLTSSTEDWGTILVAFKLATSTGTSAHAGLASGTGAAPASAMVPAQLVTGTGTAQNAATETDAAAGLAIAVLAAPPSGAAQALAAAGAGTAQGPVAQAAVSVLAGLATGTGAVPLSGETQVQRATGTGAALQASVTTTGAASAHASAATGTGTAPASGMALAGQVSGTGAAQSAIAGTGAAAGLATALGAALPTGMTQAQCAAGTGTALAVGMAQAQLAAGAGTVPPPGMAQASRAAGTGTALTLSMAQAALAAALLTPAPAGETQAVPASGTGAALQATTSSGGIVTSPGLEGYGFGSFSGIPANATVISVIAAISQYGSNAFIGVPSYELWDSTSARIGPPQTGTASVSTSHIDTVTFAGVAVSQLPTLRLRIYATSAGGNSGATVSVDAVSLSVVWVPAVNGTASPAAFAASAAFPAPAIATDQTAAPVTMTAVASFPAATVAILPAMAFPGALVLAAAFPAAAPGTDQTASPGTLALGTVFPAPVLMTDETSPGWAAADDVQAGGSGSWTNAGNVIGTPDGSVAVWAVP